jgi:general secretion pathway protein G
MNTRSGFTLLEILVVVMIITILAAVVGVQVVKEPDKARRAAATAQIDAFKNALQLYRMHHSRYPTQEQGLEALCTEPTSEPVPRDYPAEGYLESRRLPLDPWGNDYVYLIPGLEGAPYDIICYGADNEPGGTGADADILSSDL